MPHEGGAGAAAVPCLARQGSEGLSAPGDREVVGAPPLLGGTSDDGPLSRSIISVEEKETRKVARRKQRNAAHRAVLTKSDVVTASVLIKA